MHNSRILFRGALQGKMLRKLCSVTGPKISDFSGAALQCPTARQVHCSG